MYPVGLCYTSWGFVAKKCEPVEIIIDSGGSGGDGSASPQRAACRQVLRALK